MPFFHPLFPPRVFALAAALAALLPLAHAIAAPPTGTNLRGTHAGPMAALPSETQPGTHDVTTPTVPPHNSNCSVTTECQPVSTSGTSGGCAIGAVCEPGTGSGISGGSPVGSLPTGTGSTGTTGSSGETPPPSTGTTTPPPTTVTTTPPPTTVTTPPPTTVMTTPAPTPVATTPAPTPVATTPAPTPVATTPAPVTAPPPTTTVTTTPAPPPPQAVGTAAPSSAHTPTGFPPIAEQQIPTASVPMQPPPPGAYSAAPPAPPPFVGSGSSTPDTVSSLADLDRGAALWSYIAPDEQPLDDPLTEVAPLTGTAHADPLPQQTEVRLSDNLSMEVRKPLRHRTVPGIDPVTSGSGNRGLWFEDRR